MSGDPQAFIVQARCYEVSAHADVSQAFAFYPYSEYVNGHEFLGYHAAGDNDLLVVAQGESDADANYGTRGGLKLPVKIYNLAAFDSAGAKKFYPFGKDYELPIRVAMGDVNGDGEPEIVCATGPFAASQRVRVFDSSGNFIGPEIRISDQTGSRMWNGSNIATADVNSDGIKEIIVAPGPAFPQAVTRGIPYFTAGPPVILIYSGVTGNLVRELDLSPYLGASFLSGFSVAGGDVAPGSGEEIIVGVGVVGASGVLVLNGQGDLLRSFNTFSRYRTKGEIWVVAGNVISEEIRAGETAPKDYDEIIVGNGQWATGKSGFEIYDALGNYKTQEEVYAIGCGVRPAIANNPRGGSPCGTAGPTITLSTDAGSYRAGSSVNVSCAIQKGVFPYTHTGNLFFWVEAPGGLRFYLTGSGSWTRAMVPFYRNVTLRQTPMSSLFSFPIPANVTPGNYALSAALYSLPQGALRDLFSNSARVDFSVAR